jgi:hypothetical protein
MRGIFKLVIVVLSIAAAGVAQDVFIVDNADDGDGRSVKGGWWYTYNDNVQGGNSFVVPPVNGFRMSGPGYGEQGYGEQGYAVHMKGSAGDKLGWDYVGVGVTLTEESGCPKAVPLDLRSFSKIRFMMKGSVSGGRLTMILTYTENGCKDGSNAAATLIGWADYEAPLTSKLKPEWTQVQLDLRKDFHQPKWAKKANIVSIEKVLENMKNINFHFSSPDGDSVDLWVDNIEFVK